MNVTIQAIKFNHDPNSTDHDALTIRKNETEDIYVPEWEDNAGTLKTSAAAYARSQAGNLLKIAVRLQRQNAAVQSVQVSAQSTSVLGNAIAAQPIVFSQGNFSDYVLLPLSNTKLNTAVGKSEIAFDWTLVSTLSNGQKQTEIQRTKHTIYTLLEEPKAPWGPQDDPHDYEFPWTDVLDRACDWAAGAKNRVEVATLLTQKFSSYGHLGRLKYDIKDTSSHLAIPGTDRFGVIDFLRKLGSSSGCMVNCTDCAILVSSFANILGCNLYQSQMGFRFHTNPVRLIGFDHEQAPRFEFHEVAWEDPCKADSPLFDCCLEVDGDTNPKGGDFTPLLPVNIRFGQGTDYEWRLAQIPAKCSPYPSTKKRRKIARQRFTVRRVHPEFEKILKAEFDFSSWVDVPSPAPVFHGQVEDLTEGVSFSGWRIERLKVLKSESDNMALSETIWRTDELTKIALRVIIYKCVSVSAAREFLLNLLGSFHMPVIKRREEIGRVPEPSGIGDVAFSGPEDFTLLFARSNLVVFIQNDGDLSTSVASFARASDANILQVLEAEIRVRPALADNQETQSQPSPTTETTINQEKNTMSVFNGTRWTSTRPLSTTTPNRTQPDGIFEIESVDPATGAVEGQYFDIEEYFVASLHGTIKFNGAGTYVLELYYNLPGPDYYTRYHQGQLVADGEVSLVAGRWVEVPTTNHKDTAQPAANGGAMTNGGQQEGVWVATKP